MLQIQSMVLGNHIHWHIGLESYIFLLVELFFSISFRLFYLDVLTVKDKYTFPLKVCIGRWSLDYRIIIGILRNLKSSSINQILLFFVKPDKPQQYLLFYIVLFVCNTTAECNFEKQLEYN